MKQAVIISYYRWWEKRQSFFFKWLIENKYNVEYVIADFDHISKTYSDGQSVPEACRRIHVPSYSNNISLKRAYSNYIFGVKITNYLYEKNPDIVVCLIPSNFLGDSLTKYRKKNRKAVIIVDVLDLWPETLPLNCNVKHMLMPLFLLWKAKRKKAFKASSYVIFECNLFKQLLTKELNRKESAVLYLQKNGEGYAERKSVEKGLVFGYIGSINNIVDIECITEIISAVSKKRTVTLEIIGCGIKENEFVSLAKEKGIKTVFHGAIFNENVKKEIFKRCHFGVNIFKKSVVVGLTTKSMEYLESGLPLINSIPADTKKFITEYHAGLDISDRKKVIDSLINLSQMEYDRMQQGALELFRNEFSTKQFETKLDDVMTKIVKGGQYD